MKTATASAALLLLASSMLPAAEDIDFNRDIRPILSENCFTCHGPDKSTRFAELRLDLREVAIQKGAIQPGKPDNSNLVSRIHAEEEALRMPPAWSNKSLTAEQKQLLERWIEQGADYAPHWAYVAPKRPETPEGPAAIDALLDKNLREKNLEPVGQADRRTLIRRLSFDLTGLPPTAGEVEAFVSDDGPLAYEKLVERLLASPHYGERMAVHWLDLVRYADSVGFHSDVAINVYPYRDYVIRAFNSNMPFDQFTREQLAGDLLEKPTEDHLVASAYNRLNRMTNEGGAQAKEYLAKYAADRVRNVSAVWLGSTVGCAECHDHKFDPFLQKDFYQMAAFFADIEEEGVYRGQASWGPSIRVLPAEGKKEKKQIEAQLKQLRKHETGKPEAAYGEVIAYLREQTAAWRAIEPERAWDDCSHPDIDGCEYIELKMEPGGVVQAEIAGEDKPGDVAYRLEAGPDGRPITALRLEGFFSPRFESFQLSTYRAAVLGRGERPLPLNFSAVVADHEAPDAMLRHTLDDNFHTSWGGDLREREYRQAMFVLTEPLELKSGEKLLVELVFNGRPNRTQLGRFRLSASGAEFPELPPEGLLQQVVAAGQARTEAERAALNRAAMELGAGNPDWRQIRQLERRLKALEDFAHECLITKRAGRPRPVRVLPRGNWMDDSGELVDPRPPHFLPEMQVGINQPTRFDLAKWLTSHENPLTARVFVNRLWGMLFGTPLSKTPDDLGSQGETPSNVELLDWLAVEFIESGWDVKHIIRTMVLSTAYRRSAEPTPELADADPYNRLHGRQAMKRFEAEFVRDAALRVSGLWNSEMYGPSVKPYQPAGYYRELNFPKREYHPDYNEDQFRRGVYTHWQRTFLHPSLLAFDAPPREECAAWRSVSNTPLQSLTLLNDPTYVEAARGFAARILQSGAADDEARINFAFREALAREALPEEKDTLLRFLRSRRDYFHSNGGAAEKLLAVGIWEAPKDLDQIELAAWTSVSRAILNKHEFVTRY